MVLPFVSTRQLSGHVARAITDVRGDNVIAYPNRDRVSDVGDDWIAHAFELDRNISDQERLHPGLCMLIILLGSLVGWGIIYSVAVMIGGVLRSL